MQAKMIRRARIADTLQDTVPSQCAILTLCLALPVSGLGSNGRRLFTICRTKIYIVNATSTNILLVVNRCSMTSQIRNQCADAFTIVSLSP